jgi:hypothetical protein
MIGFFGKRRPIYPLIMGPLLIYKITIKIITLTNIRIIETTVLLL